MIRVIGLLLGLALLVPAVSFAADLTAEQILAKVSQTYRGLESFRFVERREGTVPRTAGYLPETLVGPFGGYPVRYETDLAVSSPGKIRLLLSSQEGKILLVSSGRKTWAYIPNLNEYTEAGGAPLLQELWANPIDLISDELALYRNLTDEVKRAKLRGQETLSLRGRNVRCYVVDAPPWQTFWVDERRFIVLRSSSAATLLPNGGSRTSRLTEADLGPIPNNAFQFDVPRGARRVGSFSTPGEPGQAREEVLAALLIGAETMFPYVGQPGSWGAVLQGTKAHGFTLGSLGGESVRLDRLHGKIVVLDFWASWCQPCQEELAAMQKLHGELASKGVVFLGIDDEGSDIVQDFVKSHGYTFPMLLDSKETVHGDYGVRLAPTTVVIDRKGKIAAHYVGAGGEAQLRRALSAAGLDTTKP